MKVSLAQPAGKMLPTTTVQSAKTPAGDFFAVLAEGQGVEKSGMKKHGGNGPGPNDTGTKMKPRAKEDDGTRAQSVALPSRQGHPTPTASLTALALATKHDVAKDAQPVEDGTAADPQVGTVSSSIPSAVLVENAHTPERQISSTRSHSPSFNDALPSQPPSAAPAESVGHNDNATVPADALTTAESTPRVANILAEESAPTSTLAHTSATAGATPTGVLNAKETQPTRPGRNSSSTASTLDSVFQKAISAFQSRTEASEAVKAAIKPLIPTSGVTPTRDHTRPAVAPETNKNTAKEEEVRTQPSSGAAADSGNRTSQHSKNEIPSSTLKPNSEATASVQDHPQNTTAMAGSKSEIPASAQVLHAAVGSQAGAGDISEKVSTSAAAGTAHPSSGPAHLNAEDGAVIVPIYAVHAARLVERIGESELRVGVNAGEFGKVDIRTSMGRNQFNAEISVERGELGRVLAAELPNLHTRLSEQHLPNANITVQDYSAGASGHQQGSRQDRTLPQMTNPSNGAGEHDTPWLPPVMDAMETGTGLDIHM